MQPSFHKIGTQVYNNFEYEKPLGDYLIDKKHLVYNNLA